MTKPMRLLLILDAFPGMGTDEWVAALPSSSTPDDIFALSQFGAPRLEVGSMPAWIELGMAVEKLGEAALARASNAPESVEFYVGGQAPLPLFVHLGFRLSKFAGRQVFLARGPGGGAVDTFDLGRAPMGKEPFTRVTPLAERPAFGSGAVAVYVDTGGRPPLEERIAKALNDAGQGSLALLEVRSDEPVTLTPESSSGAGLQLAEFFSRVPSLHPNSESLAVFVAGPTLLAFLVGRAMNASSTPRVLLMNFNEGSYALAYALPLSPSPSATIDTSAEGKLRRRETRDRLVAGIEELRKEIEVGDVTVATPISSNTQAAALVSQLGGLLFSTSETDEFELSLSKGELSFGTGLLEAMRGLDDVRHRDLAKLFVLHELVHDVQALRTTNFRGVGRAAVALEQVDYLADAFAIRTALHVEVRRGGARAAEASAVRDALVRLVEATISGVEAFDQMDHGARIDRLTERRLRRYLIWHMQLARARTITKLADADVMLSDPLTVELAPVLGRIDPRRYEKVVTQVTADTELFCAVGGQLVRVHASHEFDPQTVLESLRAYGRQPLEKVMNYVVDEHRRVLVAWRP